MIINENQRPCFICEDFWFNSSKDIIRHSVCKKLPVVHPHNGNLYCVLHLPDETKHERTDYFYVLSERINNEEFDFSYVYFPEENFSFYGRTITKPVRFWFSVFLGQVTFDKVTFEKEADFRFAIFEKHTSFHNTKFLDTAIFPSTIFKKRASFHSAEFLGRSDFLSATFEADADFNSATFKQQGNFRNSKFDDEVSFGSTHFVSGADFVSVVFNKLAVFSSAIFEKGCCFYWAVFKGRGEFSGVTFHEDALFDAVNFTEESEIDFKQTIFKKAAKFGRTIFSGYVNFSGLGEKQVFSEVDCVLDLQEARFVNPEKLVFRSVLLNPRWFIAADSRKITFIDIDEKFYNADVKNELKKLEGVGINNSKQLFKITCRQLAENAENNNRFEEASNFRRMAFETEWLEKKEKISNWIKNLVPESEKLKRRFGGSTNEEDKPIPPTNSFGILRRSGDFFIHGLYRITSFYGESWSLALGILLSLILVIFPIIYSQTQFQISPKAIPLEVVVVTECKNVVDESKPVCSQIKQDGLGIWNGEAILHSLTAVTFQDVEYRRPISFWAEFWTILEKIFAPLQAALLALAIRRKFMR